MFVMCGSICGGMSTISSYAKPPDSGGERVLGRCHTVADGRADATPILLQGMALASWGEKGALIDVQECSSYLGDEQQ